MRIVGILVVLVTASSAAASCVAQQNDQQLLDASLDQSAPFCLTDKDCASGLSCTYEVLVGCRAKGECREVGGEGGPGSCGPATTACGCDGTVVQIPECWGAFAPAPVLPSGMTTCGDARGG